MTDRQIMVFLEIAKEESFSKAASNLYMSQPNLSRMIATLEKDLNVSLFFRYPNRTIRLTEAGQIYYEAFTKCIATLHDAQKKSQTYANAPIDFHLGFCYGWDLSEFLPPILSELKSAFPLLNIHLESHLIEDIPRLIQTGKLDVGIVFENVVAKTPGIFYKHVLNLPKIIVYSKNLIAKRPEELKPTDFKGLCFYMHSEEKLMDLQKELADFFGPYHFLPEVQMVPNQSTVLSSVEYGSGVAVTDCWSQQMNSTKIQSFHFPYAHSIALAYHKSSDPKIVSKLDELLQKACII